MPVASAVGGDDRSGGLAQVPAQSGSFPLSAARRHLRHCMNGSVIVERLAYVVEGLRDRPPAYRTDCRYPGREGSAASSSRSTEKPSEQSIGASASNRPRRTKVYRTFDSPLTCHRRRLNVRSFDSRSFVCVFFPRQPCIQGDDGATVVKITGWCCRERPTCGGDKCESL